MLDLVRSGVSTGRNGARGLLLLSSAVWWTAWGGWVGDMDLLLQDMAPNMAMQVAQQRERETLLLVARSLDPSID
jgi:hypothetical protein